MKSILVLLLLVAVAIGLVHLENYSAGLRLETFTTRTRQIAKGMPEEAIIKAMAAEPNQRIDLRLHKEDYYEACRKAGASVVLSYQLDRVGWFKNFGITTSWDEFAICLNQEGHVIETEYKALIRAGGPQSRDHGTLTLSASIVRRERNSRWAASPG